MANEPNPGPASELRIVHQNIADEGYALTTEWDIGLPPKCAKYLRETYFDTQLRCDKGDQPADRERARDVILYEWENGEPILKEYETIAIRDRSGIKGERIHKRIELLRDEQFRDVIKTFLSLVPEDRRQQKGTFGVNLFRTHTDVVTRPHRDDEEFIIIYFLDREGDGAESYLYRHDQEKMDHAEDGELVLWKQLNSGDLLIFDDSRFKHGATPLTPPPGGRAKRDVVICTVDYPTTYLRRDLAC
jgi:2OG-Fe dioxygenase